MAVSVNVFDANNVEVKQLSTKTVTVSFDDGNLNSVTLFISPDNLSALADRLLVATIEMLEIATADEPVEGVFSAMSIDGELTVPAISKQTA